jgi:hypothetical protein
MSSGTMDETINGGKNAAEKDNEKNPPILADSREKETRKADERKGAGQKTRETDEEKVK